MRASRLLSILITLQLRGRATARELAERLEVSRRTILRDVDELSAAGVPIYAERGAQGGFALHDGYRTDLTGLDAVERDALFVAALPSVAADLGLTRAARTARLKIAAAVAKTGRRCRRSGGPLSSRSDRLVPPRRAARPPADGGGRGLGGALAAHRL